MNRYSFQSSDLYIYYLEIIKSREVEIHGLKEDAHGLLFIL